MSISINIFGFLLINLMLAAAGFLAGSSYGRRTLPEASGADNGKRRMADGAVGEDAAVAGATAATVTTSTATAPMGKSGAAAERHSESNPQTLSEETGSSNHGGNRSGAVRDHMESTEIEQSPHRKGKNSRKFVPGWAIGSPVEGVVTACFEGNRRGAVIAPDNEFLYAPAAGKIVKLYPMGNAMLLRTPEKLEIMLSVGTKGEDLHSMYYRPRVVQNEIVPKGKLLLEFDKEGLEKEGVEVAVSISVEVAEDFRSVQVIHKERVHPGEELLRVAADIHSELC